MELSALWRREKLIQYTGLQSEYAPELLLASVESEMQLSGELNPLIRIKCGDPPATEILLSTLRRCSIDLVISEEDCVLESRCYLAECFSITRQHIEIASGILKHAFSYVYAAEGWYEYAVASKSEICNPGYISKMSEFS